MKVFFHIGIHKTASTWLQRQLFPRLEDVRYLHTDDVNKIVALLEQATSEAPSLTTIVSHEGLGCRISHRRIPNATIALLAANLELFASLVPDRAIIVGYREHQSWLQSAFAQRGKHNTRVNWSTYLKLFSLEELLWCRHLRLIESSCPSVFPFLYEEFLSSPEILVGDLCRFLGKSPPRDLEKILRIRENLSPRSGLGQFLSRSILKFAKPSNRETFKRHAFKIGTQLDSVLSVPPLVLPADLASALRQDWNSLIALVSEWRGRDFSDLRQGELRIASAEGGPHSNG